jgi:hypothetical protein
MLSARKTLDTSTSPPTTQMHSRHSSAAAPAAVPGVRVTSSERKLAADKKAASMASASAGAGVAPGGKATANGEGQGKGVTAATSGTIRPRKPMTVYDEAVLKVQEWNEALNGELSRPCCKCIREQWHS